MAKYRNLDPLDPLPADWTDAWQEFWSTLTPNFKLRIKPSDNTVLEVPAGTGNDQVGIAIEANPRYISASVERASPGGSARDLDVWVTGSANAFAPGTPGEVDSTDYTFALSIRETGSPPTGVAIKRQIGTAHWDGTKFTTVTPTVGVPSPQSIGAATPADVTGEAAARAAADTALQANTTAEAAARTAGDANNPSAGQKAALAGTSGTPGAGNPYVTDADARNANARTPTAHASSHAAGGSDPLDVALATRSVLDVGVLGQTRAGRVLTLADFTTLLGLSTPAGLFNLGDLTNLGSGGALVNKGSVPFGKGITGAATEAAIFAGSTGQALYIADTGVGDPFRITTGSWGCWFRTAKRGTVQGLITKNASGTPNRSFELFVDATNVVMALAFVDPATTAATLLGVTNVCDDRWHHVVVTFDGSIARIYVDGALEAGANVAGPLNGSPGPLNIGAFSADGSTAAASPHFGRIDEAFVTADVLNEDQVRMLYAVKLAHGLALTPRAARVSVRRNRRGRVLATSDFTATPKRLYNLNNVLTDLGTNGANGANHGTPVTVAGPDGAASGGVQFDGAAAYIDAVDTGLPAGTAARSTGAWFKTASLTTQDIVEYGSAGTPGQCQSLRVLATTGTVGITDGTNTLEGPVVADGQWHLALAVIDNSAADGLKTKLYLDGRLVAATATLVGTALALGGAGGFSIGRRSTGANYLSGSVARVFVTDYATAADEIASLYAKGSVALGASPYPVDEVVEQIDATNLYVIADALPSQHQIDLGVAA